MKNFGRVTSAFLLVVSMLLSAVLSLNAQDDPTQTPEGDPGQAGQTSPIICESSLILLVGLAQRDYGFQPSLDMNQFEQGQYRSYFEDNMMNDDNMGAEVTEEAGMGGDTSMDMTSTPEAGAETGAAVFLNPPVVLNEDVRCTELRQSVEEFFSTDRRGMNDDNMDGETETGS